MKRVLYLTNDNAILSDFLIESLRELGFVSDKYTLELQHEALEYRHDVLISDRYPFKIPSEIISAAGRRSINLHASWLPAYRGSYPILFSILEGSVPCWSIHRVAEKIDCGEIIANGKVYICMETDTLRSVWLRCQTQMLACVVSNVLSLHTKGVFLEGSVTLPPSDKSSFYYRKDFERVRHLLTKGWNTRISEVFGVGV